MVNTVPIGTNRVHRVGAGHMMKTLQWFFVVVASLVATSGVDAQDASTWETTIPFDPGIRVGNPNPEDLPARISPNGVKVTGVDHGGCQHVAQFMENAALREIEIGYPRGGIQIDVADVHCVSQADGTWYIAVILGSHRGFSQDLLGRSYVTSDPSADWAGPAEMEIREYTCGRRAVEFLMEEGIVNHVAILAEDRYGIEFMSLWPSEFSNSYTDFAIIRQERRIVALTLSVRPCRPFLECERNTEILAIVEHGSQSKLVESEFVPLGTRKPEIKAREDLSDLSERYRWRLQTADQVQPLFLN
jgi:hypothetical protein